MNYPLLDIFLASEQVSEYNAPQDEGYRAYSRSEAQGRQSADELTKLADLPRAVCYGITPAG